MNGAEKKVFILAIFLLGLGALVRYSPWDPVPHIESFEYAENDSNGIGEQEMKTFASSDSEKGAARDKKPKGKRAKKPVVHFPISINKASAEELCAIKGVGPKLAEKIIEYRNAHGAFSGAKDLKKESGIGKKKAEALLGFIVFD